MQVYVVYNQTTGKPVAVHAEPFERVMQQYGSEHFGCRVLIPTAQGARFEYEGFTLEATLMNVTE